MIPNAQIVIPQWLAFTPLVRSRLIEIFNIPKSEGTNVVDGRVVSDGHSHTDLKHISIPAMQEYLGIASASDEDADFFWLFDMTLRRIGDETEEVAPVPVVVAPKIQDELTVEVDGKKYKLIEIVEDDKRLAAVKTGEAPITTPVKNKGGRPKGRKKVK